MNKPKRTIKLTALHVLTEGLFGLILFIPLISYGHERQIIKLGNADYLFLMGLENESGTVGRIASFEFSIGAPVSPRSTIRPDEPEEKLNFSIDHSKSLKVEVTADNQKRSFDIQRDNFYIYKTGIHRIPFYPTTEGIYHFRIFGTVDNHPIDVSVACTPVKTHEEAEAVHPPQILAEEFTMGSPLAVRKYKSGGFQCPLPEETFKLPRMFSKADLQEQISQLGERASGLKEILAEQQRHLYTVRAGFFAIIMITFVSALIIRVLRWWRARESQTYY